MTSPPPSQEAPPPSTLSTLQAFLRAQHNRTALSAEIESALTSFLTNNPTPLLDTAVVGSCSAEVVRPPNEIELGEVLKIGFKGLMEVKDEVEDLEAILRVVCKRDDLANLLKKVEALENDRLRETLQRDQLRRLAVLDPDQNFNRAISDANAKRQILATQINDELEEVAAEIAELSAEE